MQFWASKLFWAVADPATLLMLALLAGAVALWTSWRRVGRILVAGSMAVIVLLDLVPVGDWLMVSLENRFPRVTALPGRIDGIITLGGFGDQFTTVARGQPSVNSAIERLTEFMVLAEQHPEARLVVSGGSGDLLRQDVKESLVTRQIMAQWGFETSRVVFEEESRNTYENAVFSKQRVQPAAGERWVLITSALHMPRAVAVFRAAGWPVIPYPVDYVTDGQGRWVPQFNLGVGLARLSGVAHEWAGLLAYRLMGRSNTLFPAADPQLF